MGGEPGSVAEMREPKRSDGMMEAVNLGGIALPVRLAKVEPATSAPLRE